MTVNELFKHLARELPGDEGTFIDLHIYRGGCDICMSDPDDERDGEYHDVLNDVEGALLDALKVTKGEA